MPKKSKARPKAPTWPKGLAWTEPPIIAPIPSGGKVRPYEKREPVPWPLQKPLSKIAEELATNMNLGRDAALPSEAIRWAITRYAENGTLPWLEDWPSRDWRMEAETALGGFRFSWIRQPMRDPHGTIFDTTRTGFGYFGPGVGPDKLTSDAYPWLCLAVLVAHTIPIRRCAGCRRFYTDPNRRGKIACSIACGNRLRALAQYQRLKAKPRSRKYQAHLKRQRELMRERRARRRA